MEPVTVKPISFDELEYAPNFSDLIEEYCAESGLPVLGCADVQSKTYRAMESTGAMRLIAAFINGELIGFINLLSTVLPHFGKPVFTAESFFVAGRARKSGAGIALLKAAEQAASESGALGIYVSAPIGSRIERVLPGVGFKAVHQVYFKEAACSQH